MARIFGLCPKIALEKKENTVHNVTASKEEERTEFIPHRSYNTAKKKTSNADSFLQLSSAKKTTSGGGKKMVPLPNRPHNFVVKSGMKAPEKKENTQNTSRKKTIPLWKEEVDSQPVHYEKSKFLVEISTELVRYLATKDDYKVYGYWFCKYAEDCHEHRKLYTRESFENYLKNPKNLNFFEHPCKICKKEEEGRGKEGRRRNMIKSFFLHPPQEYLNPIEIICHLEWNNHYRVFGSWRCSHCQKEWKSAYTWVSLQKYIDQIPGENLNQGDFYMQKCKRCKNCKKCNNDKNIIEAYEPLVLSEGPAEHKYELCAKCKYYRRDCTQLDNYFGDQGKRYLG